MHRAGRAALGFGCASLYALPSKRDRRLILDAAYESGIRHFDVAPIYGLGVAQGELAEFVAGADDIRLATKFGIDTTVIGRLAGLTQSPVRQVLRMLPALNSRMRDGSRNRSKGVIDRILYSDRDYSASNARRVLTESLRILGVDRVDYFFLHEPGGLLSSDHRGLIEYLQSEARAGRIGYWGPAGDLSGLDGTELSRQSTAKQLPYDLIRGYRGPGPRRGQATISYGFLSEALPRVRAVLEREPVFRKECSELVDVDLAKQENVVRLLVRDVLTTDPEGTVLISTTKMRHLSMICTAADAPLPNEAQVATMIRRKCGDGGRLQ